MIFRLTIVHGKYKAEACDNVYSRTNIHIINMPEKEVVRSGRKRGGVASENRSAVDTENAESEDQNMSSDLKRKDQL
jgi:hypothetical protein